MKAIQVTGPRRLQLTDVPVPEPADGEVLVKLEALSVCGTDMMAYRHPQPEEDYPLGHGTPCHECAGTIVQSQLEEWPVGRRGRSGVVVCGLSVPPRHSPVRDRGSGREGLP